MANPPLEDRLRDIAERTLRRNRHVYGIQLGVRSDPAGLHWTGAAGTADPSTGAPMRTATPYAIASVTKLFTAAATMILVERGRLGLADPMTKHLPAERVRGLHVLRGRDHTDMITIRHLLAHTTGFPDYFLDRPKGGRSSAFDRLLTEGDREWELDDVIAYTRAALPPRFVPAAYPDDAAAPHRPVRAHYSDTNYKLLGAILESVSGRAFHTLLAELLFEPLGLDDTWVYGHPRRDDAPAMAPILHRDRPLEVDRVLRTHASEGGIVSTLDDQLRFSRAFAAGRCFRDPDATLAAMQQWNRIFFPIQYGFGMMRFRLSRWLSPFGFSPDLVGHSGSSGSFLFHEPSIGLHIAGTINQMTLARAPFPLMIRVAQAVHRAAR